MNLFLEKIKISGDYKKDRIISFGDQFEIDLSNSFPLLNINLSFVLDKILEFKVECPSKLESIFILQNFSLNPTLESFQLHVKNGSVLEGKVYIKVCDIYNRLPIRIVMYSLLLHMISHILGYKVGKIIYSMGEVYLLAKDVDKDLPDNNINLSIIKKCEIFKDFTLDCFSF